MKRNSLEQIQVYLENKQSFILEAGAGSGKTWTLIQSLKYLLNFNTEQLIKYKQKIACITFTNVAKNEISERIDFNPLVSIHTIHEFLWSIIKNYPTDLKSEILVLNSQAKQPIDNLENLLSKTKLEYSQYGSNFSKGKLFHDDIIKLSSRLFSKSDKISKITSCQYPFIFIDEYQDTEQSVVSLLIENLLHQNQNKITLGFFGDSMQTIYPNGNGSITSSLLETVTKEENYRCSQKVIYLLNKIRTNIQQFPAGNNNEGSIGLYHCNNVNNVDHVLEELKTHLINYQGWDVISKILMLTHKNIAQNLKFEQLLQAYNHKGRFGRERLYDKDEIFANFMLGKIEHICDLYERKEFGELISLLKGESYAITTHTDKEKFQSVMKQLNKLRNTSTVKDVLSFVFDNFLDKPKQMRSFEIQINQKELDKHAENNKRFFDALMQVKYIEIIRLYNFIQECTPFSTKHGIKGAEFENVLVIVDDNSWNQYKFDSVLSSDTSRSQYQRSLNLFYVCCSRAKNNLAILFTSNISPNGLENAKSWFDGNVFDMAKIEMTKSSDKDKDKS